MEILLGILFGIIAMFSWGISLFLTKEVVKKYGNLQALTTSQIIGIIPVVIITLFMGFQIPTTGTTAIIAFAVFLSTIAYLSFFKGVEVGQASTVTTIASASSIITLIVSFVFLNEKLIFNQLIGIILVVAGILMVSFKKIKKTTKIAEGIPFGIISMLAWGFTSLFYVFILREVNFILSVFYLRGFMVLFLIAFSKFKKIKFPALDKRILLLLAIVGILDTSAILAFQYGLTIGLLSLVGPIGSSYAAVTVVLAYFFLKERLLKNQKIGVVLLILGIILASLIF